MFTPHGNTARRLARARQRGRLCALGAKIINPGQGAGVVQRLHHASIAPTHNEPTMQAVRGDRQRIVQYST
jgi:hypothetical protein